MRPLALNRSRNYPLIGPLFADPLSRHARTTSPYLPGATMVSSQNGWSANQRSQTQAYTVGNGRKIQLRKGDAGFVLKHFADWFDQKIEDIDQGADDWGYAERNVRGSATEVSNHASGTAMDLNATKHPLGKRGTFSKAKTSAIRQRLKLYDGVIRWGGDYRNRADEMHFELNADSAAVSAVAAKLRAAQSSTVSNLKKLVTPRMPSVPIEVTRIRNAINNRRPLPLADLEALIKRGTKPYAAAAKALRDAMQPALRAWLDATTPKPAKKAVAKKTTTKKAPAKKAPAKKTVAKKAPAKKASAKKAP